MRRAAAVVAGAVVLGLALAGCGSAPVQPPGAVYQSAEQATVSWFYAINHKDKADTVAHLTRAAEQQAGWGAIPTSKWSTFSALHCKLVSQASRTASVRCTFAESPSPSEGNPDTFWTVYLTRVHHRWLINSYGQG
jgi:hypothetical protein